MGLVLSSLKIVTLTITCATEFNKSDMRTHSHLIMVPTLNGLGAIHLLEILEIHLIETGIVCIAQ